MRLALAALLPVLLFGCGGSDAGIFEDKDGGTTPTEDSASTTTDSSTGPTDSSTPTEDDGPPPVDSGTPTTDSGDPPPPIDTGTTKPDTAPPPLDTGVVTCTEPGGKMYMGHCYFPTMPRAWTNARDTCSFFKAHLVTITSDGEQAFVNGISSGDRWIGLYRPEGTSFDKASYKWITPEAVTYSNWESMEPNFSGSCVRLRDTGQWADYSCSQNLTAICERE